MAAFAAVKTEFPDDDLSSSFHVRSFGETVIYGDKISSSHQSDVDEDELVREIDVYISPALSQQLHLIQYPLTPAATADTPKILNRNAVAARYKPRNQMVELDFPVNHDSFATQKRPNGIPYGFDLKQRTYTSTSIDLVTHTALGIMNPNGDSIHLIPLVHPTQQMRPSFKHIDDITAERNEDSNSNHKEASKYNNNSNREEDVSDDMGEQPILLQKKESDKTIAIRQSSYAYKKALQAAEDWIELQVQTDKSHRSVVQNKRREAYCSHLKRNLRLAPGAAGQKAYVSTLNYLPISLEDVDRISSSVAAATSSERYDEEGHLCNDEEEELLRELTAKLTTTLQRGVPIPLSMMEHQYPDIDPLILIKSLLGCAVVVRGNFVIKSSLWGLNPTEQDVRDAIILLLNRYGHLQRYRLLPCITAAENDEANNNSGKLNEMERDNDYFDGDETAQHSVLKEEALDHIIKSICRKVEGGWECKLEDDDTLAARFPLMAAAYAKYWALRQSQIQKYLDLYERMNES